MSATVDAMKFSKYLDGAPILNVPGRTFPVQTQFLEDAVELTGFVVNEDGYRKNKFDNDEDEFGDDERDEAGTAMVTFENYSTQTQKTMKQLDEWEINYDLIVELLLKIAQSSEYQFYSKAILIFLPGLAEIRKLNDMLLGHPFFHGFKNDAPGGKWVVYPLHSTIANEDQEQAFLVPPQGTRKIVLATNIAETGITIPDITCVIDSVKHKEMRFDEKKQLSRLISTFISRANAKQRRGRAGRVQNGLCFHLITKNRHDTWLKEQQEPEMLRLSLQDLILRVKICKLGGIEDTLSQALDAPSSRSIRRAMESLIETKALTTSEELTALGRQLAKLPLDVYLGKLLLLGCMHQCIDVAVTIAAIISSKSPFISPFGQRAEADTVKLGYQRGDSDLLTTWNAYLAWRRIMSNKTMNEYDFCRKNFLSSRTLSNIEDLKQQLFVSLLDAKFITLDDHHRHSLMQSRYNSSSGRHYHRHFFLLPENLDKNSLNDNLVTSVIASAFYPKLLAKDGKNSWRNIVNNQKIGIHPTSVNKRNSNSNKIHWLSYYNIMQANKYYNAHETSAADHLAIALLCGDAEFKMYSGAMIIDGHRVRFTFDTWKMTAAVRILRARIREMNHRSWKQPGRVWTEYETKWRDLANEVLSRCGNHQIQNISNGKNGGGSDN